MQYMYDEYFTGIIIDLFSMLVDVVFNLSKVVINLFFFLLGTQTINVDNE